MFPKKTNTNLSGPLITRILFIRQAKGHLAKRGNLGERQEGQVGLREEVVAKGLQRKGPLRGSLWGQGPLECLHSHGQYHKADLRALHCQL